MLIIFRLPVIYLRLPSFTKKLLIDEPTLLDKIRDNQRNCKDVDGAKTIAKKVIELFKDNS